jgi:hypothetical protein
MLDVPFPTEVVLVRKLVCVRVVNASELYMVIWAGMVSVVEAAGMVVLPDGTLAVGDTVEMTVWLKETVTVELLTEVAKTVAEAVLPEEVSVTVWVLMTVSVAVLLYPITVVELVREAPGAD